MAINKIVKSDGTVLIDLTGDTITADKLLSGFTAHGMDGEPITGSCSYDVDSQDATALVAELLDGKTAYARGVKLTGTMPNRGAVAGEISEAEGVYTIPQGYHDGSGSVRISATERAKLIAANIKAGVVILGVTGRYGGEQITAQTKSATPGWSAQTITPDEGYDYLSQVTVAAIPYAESENTAGGITVTIG